jgi:kynurenine formamidase
MANPRSKMRVTNALLDEYAEKYKNWGRWGPNDEIGTLNFTTPQNVVDAAKLVKKGKIISLALNFDQFGPQGAKTPYPAMGRFNPVHTMTRTGTDAYSGVLDHRGIRGTDDIVTMPLQCGTQWDGLGHVFFRDWMWNGYDCREVTSAGAQKAGIEKTKNKMTGRGIFLDIPKVKGVKYLDDGYPITCDDLDEACEKLGVEVCEGDFVVLRTGQMERCLEAKSWDGYAGGDAPGAAFETIDWLHRNKVAGVGSDTWGFEVRPCETDENINQPWHWIAIPILGLTIGEIWYLKELAEDCAADGVYEFLFCAPAIPITGAVGSPVNPLVIK